MKITDVKRIVFAAFCTVVLTATVLLLGFIAFKVHLEDKPDNGQDSNLSYSVSERPTFPETEATVLSIGDIMVHSPQLTGAYVPSTGEYDFTSYFRELEPYFKRGDLNVGNLEVTFGGNEGRAYTGYPAFNCPDSLADAIKASGLNLLLTSNNHSYDTGLSGLKRTVQVLKAKGLDFTGTRETETDPSYIVKTVNNIKIGIINYTYETPSQGEAAHRKYLNGVLINSEANGLINSFDYNKIDVFYSDIEGKLNAMRNDGAELLVVYIHWGNEYKTEPNLHQKSIAQHLCNMGVDVIIGSHPHVIEPVELITSEDSTHNTICLYSTGNAISNQRQERMTSCPTGHTEDGMIFGFTVKKTRDGVFLKEIDLIPTWVNVYPVSGRNQYAIYPIENPDDLDKFGFTAAALNKAKRSYERTREIVAEGLTQCQQSLGCEITFK